MINLTDVALEFGIILSSEQQQAFEIYYRELVDWNARMNLTAIIEHDQVIVKHFLDSLSVAPILQPFAPTLRLIDVGTGAGFPGIPLKIALPDLHLTLLETTGKKVQFLKHIIDELHLTNATAIQARAEDLGHDASHRGKYDVAIARAVANMATLSEYCLPFVRKGGVFIAQKGVDVQEEVHQAEHAIKVLGGHLREIVPVQLPGLEPRHIIVIEKIEATPDAFPRRAGTPQQKPLA